MGRLTWFKLGGRAEYLFQPRDIATLACGVQRARAEGLPIKVLGAGANVLVSDDGFDGMVVRLDKPAFRNVAHRGDVVEAGAGADLMPLAKQCSLAGLSGLEPMAGIPATVGGALCMNAGGRFGEFGDVVRDADVMLPDGRVECWTRDQMDLGYRRSGLRDAVVLNVRLGLRQDDPVRVRESFEEKFAYKTGSQPLAAKSAGCIFKNPEGQSAGALIDRAGLKGLRCGGASVSQQHGNFIIADAGATASDVLRLIDLMRARVFGAFAIELEVEVDIWSPVREGVGA